MGDRLTELNRLDAVAAARELGRCCGSTRWARLMVDGRPYVTVDAVLARSDAVCAMLERADWLEAFAAHPRIGARQAGGPAAPKPGTSEGGWSAEEQSGVTDDSRERLERLNDEYARRFGYIFIICATGKSGAEMLRALERRLGNNPTDELREAADEQRRIARLRLAKLLT